MSCVAYREHFSAQHEGELPQAKRDLFHAHVARCVECGPSYAQFARALDALAEARRAPERTTPLGDTMLARLGLPPRAQARPGLGWLAGGLRRARLGHVAAAAALLLAGVALGRHESAAASPERASDSERVERAPAAAPGPAPAPAPAATPTPDDHATVETAWRAMGWRRLDDAWLPPDAFAERVRREAGLVQDAGGWHTPAEIEARACRAAGLVWFEGSWLTPDALAARLAPTPAPDVRSPTIEAPASLPEPKAERVASGGDSVETPPTPAPSGAWRAPAGTPPALLALVDGLRLLPAVAQGDAWLVPLARPRPAASPGDPDPPTLLPGVAALAGRQVVVEEAKGAGGVRITNRSSHPVLLVAGEILTGGAQDRLVARDVCVEPGAVATIDVRCCEQGRSQILKGETRFQGLGAWATPELRRLLLTGGAQDAIWAAITRTHGATGTASPTHALQVTYATPDARGRRQDARTALEAVAAPGGAVVGLAIVRGGGVEILDCFPDPAYFRAVIDPLVAGLTVGPADGDVASGDALRAHGAVRAALEAACVASAAAPEAREIRAGDLAGTTTVRGGVAIHLCLARPLDPAGAGAAPAPGTPDTRPVDPTPPADDPTFGELDRKRRRTAEEDRYHDRRGDRRTGSGASGGH